MSKDTAELAAELEETGRRYIAEYGAALWRCVGGGQPVDYDALGFWSFPVMLVSGASDCSAIHLLDSDAFHAFVLPGYEQYRAQGWEGGMRIDRLNITIVSPSVGIVESEGTRFRNDGTVVSTWTSLYMHKRTAAGWKQIAIDATTPRREAAEWGRWLMAAGVGADG